MPKTKKKRLDISRKYIPESLEEMENEMISLAMQRAREQLIDGTASSQIITHFCKLGSTRERVEQRGKELENDLMIAKREHIEADTHLEDLFTDAMTAFSEYKGED